ncbi:MAG: hypothetical protein WAK93_08685, partial [Solirubrobacteraceae bacterium]
MKFLRTASTRRLLTAIAGLVVAIVAGSAIAVAATSGGPVPKRESLAKAVHQALAAPKVNGISARITFTNNLIDSSDFTSQTVDPLLQGASGRLWLSSDGRLRVELQTDNGDGQLIVNKRSFWISDPAQQTIYEGTLPGEKSDKAKSAKAKSAKADAVPTVAQIQTDITHLMRSVEVSGAKVGSAAPSPGDVAGRPVYTVSISPKHDGGLIGSAQLAWDAIKGVPLKIAIYAQGDSSPVLGLKATSISYGKVSSSVFNLTPTPGYKIVKISSPEQSSTAKRVRAAGKHAKRAKAVSGLPAVSSRVPFKLIAPATLDGLPRHGVDLLSSGGKPGAVVLYGRGLGGIAVVQEAASGTQKATSSASSGSSKLNLPTASINGATGTELSTALGTVINFKSAGVDYTVVGSVPATAAERAARALGTSG